MRKRKSELPGAGSASVPAFAFVASAASREILGGTMAPNPEIVREMADAVNRRDADALVAHCAPNVDWEENTAVYPGLRRHYRGRTEVRQWFDEAVVEPWEAFDAEIEELVVAPDDRVLACAVLTARGRASGFETRLRFWQVFWFVGSEVVRRQLFLDRPGALEAAGLRE